MNGRRKIGLATALVTLCIALLCAVAPVRAAEHCASVEEAAQIVRSAMVDREAEVTITYPIGRAQLNEQEIMELLQGIYAKAIEHTGQGTEGDYLYFHQGEFRYGYGYEDDGVSSVVNCTLTFRFSYHTTASQEAELTTAIGALLATELNLSGKSEYEKVRAIYDYLCENIVYDYTNLNNEAYTLKYSAYAALIKGTAVCQGYANLFYRLANAVGLDARIVSGTSRGQGHAWNIVKVDGKYYNIDSTWDAGRERYDYFLKGSANFAEHMPGGERPENYDAYNISVTDYVPETSTTPGEPTTETQKPTEAPTERPEPMEASTERPEPTEAPTEKPESTEALTENPGVIETDESTVVAGGGEEVETTAGTETSGGATQTTEATTGSEYSAESATGSEASPETETEAEESIEITAEPEESGETIAGTEAATDEPDDAEGNMIYIVLGVAGTAVGVGAVIYRKRKTRRC